MNSNKIPATVEILTRNSAKTLRRALESVKDFAEIIILDGGSRDETLDIAHEYGARVIEQDTQFLRADGSIADFSGVRNQGLTTASYDWFFFLDSDEEASVALIDSIRNIVQQNISSVYWVNRHYKYKGDVITCSASYPNRQVRFFHRSLVSHFRKPIHEIPVMSDEVVLQTLNHGLLVPADLSESELEVRKKMHTYITLDLNRHDPFHFADLVRIYINVFRSLARLIFKSVLVALFCRGKRLPFIAEQRPFIYQFLLMKEALKKWIT